MATFVSRFSGFVAKRRCSLEDPESYKIFNFCEQTLKLGAMTRLVKVYNLHKKQASN
jgi:hypothetical protein